MKKESLLDIVKIHFGPTTAESIDYTFSELLLPLPQSGEFLGINYNAFPPDTPDGFPTLLNPFGSVIRIYNSYKIPLIRHPLMGRPIGAIQIDYDCRLEIQFTGPTGISFEESDTANEILKKSGVQPSDAATPNWIRSKHTDETFPQGKPICFDPGKRIKYSQIDPTVRIFQSSSPVINLQPNREESPDFQDQDYGHLRGKFMETYDIDTRSFNPKKMKQFWKKMEQATEQGLLSAAWNHTKQHSRADIKNTPKLAARYEKRLRTESPIFA